MMSVRLLRIGIAGGLAGFLFAFFVPFLPFTHHFPTYTFSGCYFGCPPFPSGGAYTVYESIGYHLTGWGSVYSSWLSGYVTPTVTYSLGGLDNTLSAFGFLLLFVFPAVVACVGLLAPEMVGFSRISRIGFVAFGGFTLIFSVLLLVSVVGQTVTTFPFVALGIVLCAAGGLMVQYGLRIWPLGPGNETSQIP